jgi:predicted ArsR family transcriptional regulator
MTSQARALGDPTRHAIFRYVANQHHPVDVAELTAHVGLHPNAVRQHLGRLVAAGLVDEATAPPQGRGRPRLVYTVAPNVDSRWGVVGPYEQLTVLMSEIIRSGDSPVVVGERVGRAGGGGGDASHPQAGAVDVLVERMARYGFEPTVTRRDHDVDVVLHVCPFETTALVDPDTVCGLHLGIARGIADACGDLVVDELVRNDPRDAPCVLRCRVSPVESVDHSTP